MKNKIKFLLKVAIIILAFVGACHLMTTYKDNIREGKTTLQNMIED